jgi:serine phosphatase RsbU (regulator of sigma subunit)
MKKIIIILVIFFIYSTISIAKEITIGESPLDGVAIGKKCFIHFDKSGKQTIANILNLPNKDFKNIETDHPGYGFTSETAWIKFTINNRAKKEIPWYLEIGYPLLDKIELYIPENNTYSKIKAGDTYNYNVRKIKHENFIFRVKSNPGKTTIYLKIKTTSSFNIPLKIWTKSPLDQRIILERIIFGMFYGILFVMFIYNLFVFFASRDVDYLTYSSFIIAFIMLSFVLNGIGFHYLWPGTPWWNDRTPLFLTLCDAAAFGFSMSYLNTKTETPRIHKFMLGCIVGYILASIASLFTSYAQIIPVVSILQAFGVFALMSVSILFLAKRYRAAYFFFPGWVIMLLGVGATTMKNMGLLPNNFIAVWGFQIAIILQIILFSFGLADKLNRLKEELLDLNTNLENKVNERTEELQSANEELTSMNNEIIKTRDALWGEMELAKKIQTVLLPNKPSITGYEIAGFMEAANEVGGDYYDVINEAEMDWIVIGDVSGHGVPAGLIMMMVQTAIHISVKQQPNAAPSDLLTAINTTITKNIQQMGEDKYMTLTVLAAHQEGKFIFSGLHQDIFLYRAATGEVEEIETHGVWIGVVDNINGMVENHNLTLQKGDSMLLYTDGITEAWLKDNESATKTVMFGDEQLLQLFKDSGSKSPNEIISYITKKLDNYIASDDMTLLVVKRK